VKALRGGPRPLTLTLSPGGGEGCGLGLILCPVVGRGLGSGDRLGRRKSRRRLGAGLRHGRLTKHQLEIDPVGRSDGRLRRRLDRPCLLGVHLMLLGDVGRLVAVLALGELELLGEVRIAVDVADIEERGLLQADVDEGGLHAREDPDDAPLVDVADDPLLALSLEVVLVDRAVLDQRDARLRAARVDHQDIVARHVGLPIPRPPARPSSGRRRLGARGGRAQVEGRDRPLPGGSGLGRTPFERLLKLLNPWRRAAASFGGRSPGALNCQASV
jgi:hypothetical protein